MKAPALAAILLLLVALPAPTAQAGTHFGNGNIPPGCSTAYEDTGGVLNPPHFTDGCYHMRTGLNSLDTPIIDVLLVPPASPYPERDLRVMRQAIEMWDTGIHELAPGMGLAWLDAVEFNIFVDDDEFTTHPVWDPEIVVVAANPVVAGVQGIGIDPIGLRGPCRGANPLASFQAWEALPGFDSHHDGHSGTYVEPCQGGGTTCYAVNLAIDPVPGVFDDVLGMNMFDLVAHEVGHCLSVGHVGDAMDHEAEAIPIHDIMSYTHELPAGKCVSTLDVEGFALRMSRYLRPSTLVANHADGPRGPFQIQHPDDHRYASATGLAEDCPEPTLYVVDLPPPPPPPPIPDPQDDAGSGADAGSFPASAVPIAPDVLYEGTLLSPSDGSDMYRMEAPAGSTIQVAMYPRTATCFTLQQADGSSISGSCTYDGAGATRTVVSQGAPIYLRFALGTSPSYRFGFGVDTDAPPLV